MITFLRGIPFLLLFVFYFWLWIQAWRRRAERKGISPSTALPKRELLVPLETLLSWGPLWTWLLPKLRRPQSALAVLNGGVCTSQRLLRFAAEAAGYGYGALLVCAALGWLSGSAALTGLGVLLAVLLPLLRWKELSKQLEVRRHAIVMELPELLNRLLLMVNAGENVMRALEKSLQRPSNGQPEAIHPLYAELGGVLEAVKRGEPLGIALEEFGRRCAVPEAKLFATTMLMNVRRGGELFVASLRELSRTLWERRKAAARVLGEQASSRLAFPLALIFLLIMVLVGTPSFLLMSNG